ncbi:MAG: AzlC family ABC transporter permease [Oscillospiraceae bacterium]|nr:AzlC family ABC transporter permease [Oscillospiraceae bacterium]
MKHSVLRTAFIDTVPVMTGYLFLGAGFGILMDQSGYGVGYAVLMSLFIYAGSAQYLLVSLLTSGASLLSTALATLLINARHLFYGISLVDTYQNSGRKKPYLIFALTDETYSLVTQAKLPEGMNKTAYCFLVSLFDHGYWVVGTALGSLVGALLPISLSGISFVLTALFVTMFVEQWLSTKNHRPAIIGVMSTILCLLLFGRELFLIPSMTVIAVLLTVFRKAGGSADYE